MNENILKLGNILWDYLKLNQKIEKVDALLVFGGHDPSVATHTISLFTKGFSNSIIISGGNTHPARCFCNDDDLIEADAIKEVLIRNRVPAEVILLEKKARNTSENFWYTADLIKMKGLDFNSFILVQKPYTERRTYLTGLNRWKDKKITVSSIDMSFHAYLQSGIHWKKIINMMTGEIYRLINYPKLGYFDEIEIPIDVLDAFNLLIHLGYTKRLNNQII